MLKKTINIENSHKNFEVIGQKIGCYPLKAELERIKKHLNELYTREAEALRNSRDHAELERDSLRTENERLKNSISAINQDLAVIRSQKEAEW